MLWVYGVDDIVYSVGQKSRYIPWIICRGQHRYMMWVTLFSTLYTLGIHIIYPRYMILYTVGNMPWTTSVYDVGNIVVHTICTCYPHHIPTVYDVIYRG